MEVPKWHVNSSMGFNASTRLTCIRVQASYRSNTKVSLADPRFAPVRRFAQYVPKFRLWDYEFRITFAFHTGSLDTISIHT